jgi:uncharacterized lipoprotein YajG
MKDNHFGWAVFIITIVVTAIFLLSGCSTPPDCSVCCPVCEECSEGAEDPYTCSKYYADKEELQTLFGSHDFFLKEDNNYEN